MVSEIDSRIMTAGHGIISPTVYKGYHHAVGFGRIRRSKGFLLAAMGWFRSNRGVVAWLAFFALASQLLLSFGHVHVGQLTGGSAAWAAIERGNAPGDVALSPPPKNPTGLAGDFCAICANINLAGTLVLPILAAVLAPRLFSEILQWSLTANQPASPDHPPFSARGPPHA
jgi:hypothetical protein